MNSYTNILVCILLTLAIAVSPAAVAEPPAIPGFLAGCWRGELGDGELVEEQYSSTVGGAIFGIVVTSKNGTVTFFEFIRIVTENGVTSYHPSPNGTAANVTFKLNEVQSDKMSFENLAHDFPQQISYRLLAEGKLLTRIAGTVNGRKLVDEYTTTRISCADD